MLRIITWNNVYLLVEVKPAKGVFGVQVWVKQVKIGPKIRFFIVFSSSVHFLENSICLEHCQTTSRDKPHDKISRALTWAQNYGFCHFLKVATLVFLDIAHNCRAETSKTKQKKQKINYGPTSSRNNLFYSNFVECPLKLACVKAKIHYAINHI